MLNKIVKKLLVILLCFACAMPFFGAPISIAYANDNYDNANSTVKTVFVGTEFKFKVDAFQDANVTLKDVVVYKKDANSVQGVYDLQNPVYADGIDKDKTDEYYISFTTAGNVMSITFNKVGSFDLRVQEKAEDAQKAKNYTFNVVSDLSQIKLEYIQKDESLGENSKYKKYLDSIDAVVNGDSDSDKLALGKSFEVPSVDSLIYTQIPYNSINKQVYYLTPGNSSYSSTSALAGNPKFNISAYGKYVYYVLLSCDDLVENQEDSIKIATTYLKEDADGFYQYVIENTTTNVYYSSVTETFYATKEEADNGEGTAIENAVQGALVVPKFEFTIENRGPVIEITSTYQEKGYLGSSYKVSSITVNGSERTTYTLYYKADANATPVNVTDNEEVAFDSTTLTFTPNEKGLYYVHVLAVDSVGVSVEAKTADIQVSSKYVTVSYKPAFSEWLEKNILPFVLLCVSGACLIAIICLLFIKPVDAKAKKANKQKEEKEVDR